MSVLLDTPPKRVAVAVLSSLVAAWSTTEALRLGPPIFFVIIVAINSYALSLIYTALKNTQKKE